jgi:stage III sporulation protein AA
LDKAVFYMGKMIWQQILPYLPAETRDILLKADPRKMEALEELRIRPLLPLLLRFAHDEAFLAANGCLVNRPEEGRAISEAEIRKIVLLLADSSFYAVEEELRRGYITLPGGHRAGLCGRAVLVHGAVKTLKEISSVNMRIARPVTGLAAPILPRLKDAEGRLYHTLIVSEPRGGKTTLLRDLTCAISNGLGIAPMRVGVVDERSELAAMRGGIPQLPIGNRSDVMDGCPKAEGIGMLLRSMGPEVVVCDEIGRPEDAAAILEAVGGGVRMLCSAHGGSAEEILGRPVLEHLLAQKAFERIILLSRREGPGTLEWIRDGAFQSC